ncbi:YvrJ family protein [Anaerobacillus sp. CMMVII]|uniref:YvrJ family protein n=1 Tax=Anaerobacillus sp. CMMVII TaxID=2755588 RepID=UPI0021B813EE|nr:YvrJ family protein [Anaerobacillus sp. CMMVII]
MSEYGFQVMITLYLLYRIEAKLDLLNDSVAQLAVTLQGKTLGEETKKHFKYKA